MVVLGPPETFILILNSATGLDDYGPSGFPGGPGDKGQVGDPSTLEGARGGPGQKGERGNQGKYWEGKGREGVHILIYSIRNKILLPQPSLIKCNLCSSSSVFI